MGENTNRTVGEKVDKRDLWTLFWRAFLLQGAFNFERMQALGFVYVFLPLLKKLYKTKESLTKAMKRHLAFFNTSPMVAGPIIGIVASMEEQLSRGDDSIEESSISAIKGALMGPIAGIGDSFFQGTLRPIAAGIAITFALQENAIAPFVFLLLLNVPHILVRWYGMTWGFNLGDKFLQSMDGLEVKKWMKGATIVGLIVVGALVATWLNITTPIAYTYEETTIALQGTLDAITPKLIPLLFTLFVYFGIRKGISTLRIMGILIVIGLIGGYFGILA